ncbi:MAG: TIGR03013 family PEP-CTERM/XrtA system glycosyltransferase [Gammaproteobacteria bacterium]|nr:TIGR03013 family PEP-CTERM/XrtA system glycosyltransferase [Gammaproteobacteria bacterium]
MFRIFRHYIPKTLLMLGLAEALILLVSIYLGVTLKLMDLDVAAAGVPALEPVFVNAVLFALVMLTVMVAMGLYSRDLRDSPRGVLFRLTLSFVVGLILMVGIYEVFPALFVGAGAFTVALACSFVGIASCRLLCYQYTDSQLVRRVLVLGAGAKARQIQQLRRRSDRKGIDLVGFVHTGKGTVQIPESKLIAIDASLVDLVKRYAIDEIVVALDDRRNNVPVNDILECKMRGVEILEDTTFYERQLGKIRLDSLNPSNVFFSDGFSQAVLRAGSKRLFDVVVATVFLVAALPVMILTALAIFVESGGRGPALYRQARVGKHGRVFEVYKFRSMCVDAENDGQARWAQANDDRITRVGRLIRKTRIDELPQFINVLKGDMSFVGPRPERPQFVDELAQAIPYYGLRHHVKPGITGWAQISYPYGASQEDAREKLQYDLYYLKNYSFFLDCMILLHTVQVVLWGQGSR